jgi:hypothetical protein
VRLYEISAEMRAALAVLEEREGELDDALEARLDAVEMAFGEKVDACLCVESELRAEAAALAAEGKRLADRGKARAAHAERLREYVAASVRASGVHKVDGARFTAWLQKNPPRLELTGPVPMEWCEERTTLHTDSGAIKAALLRGEPLDFARLEQGESLRVK